MVVRPADEDEVAAVMRAALDADAVLIPFGGGTSISGSLEAPAQEQRTSSRSTSRRFAECSPWTRRPASPASRPARSARTSSEQLNAQGWTLGHFPDSFTHSTLGGWIATRSSGMQSDRYGDIADLTARCASSRRPGCW